MPGGGDESAFRVFSRPNVFEVFLQEHLGESLRPAFKALVRTAHGWDPGMFGWISRRSSLAFFAVMAAVEHAHLRGHSASLSERFLGLKRVSVDGAVGLSGRQRLVSLACLVGVPLALHELKRLGKRREGLAVLRRVVPYLKAAVDVASLAYLVAYVGDLTQYATPWLHVAGVKLVSSATADGPSQQAAAAGKGLLGIAASYVADAVRLTLPLAAFGWSSLEWWYSVPHAMSGSGSGSGSSRPLPAPDPPRLCSGVTLPATTGTCPLCGQKRKNPAVLSSSGYAFCFPCIIPFVRQHHKCPLTGVPSSESQVRRLF